MALGKITRNVTLGLSSLRAHKLRYTLTMLGVVFGVASVVCMLAIGEGLSYEAREQIRRLGSNNIILYSAKPLEEMDDAGGSTQTFVLRYGLTYADVERIAGTVTGVKVVVPSREIRKEIAFRGRRVDGQVVGTVPWYLDIAGGSVLSGRFINAIDMQGGANVCVLSRSAAASLTGLDSPLNDVVTLDGDYYDVVGVVDPPYLATDSSGSGAPQTQNLVYIPLTAARLRFGEMIFERSSGSMSAERVELHRVTVQVEDSDDVLPVARVIETMLERNHTRRDYEMIVPLQLLREKERVKRLYNLVLGLMAAISLVVGGIGIMNIMLANVGERTPEIGVRRAIGARKRDIMEHFLTETVLLSGCGGLLGLAFGVTLAIMIRDWTEMHTIVTAWSIALAFGISTLVGVVFGFYPAIRAANMDPITALRHE